VMEKDNKSMHKINAQAKFALDMAPLVAFLIGFKLMGMQEATVLLMLVTFACLGIIYIAEKRLALAPLITGLMVGVFGGLTLILKDEYYIKIKPTVVNLLLAAVLLIGLKMGKPLVKYLLEVAFKLDEKGWRSLSLRWGLFFIFLAAVNEIVWRNFSTDFWVSFKLFGMLSLNILFWVAHVPFLQRHKVE
jgi:intracellular septation protein